MSKIVYKKDPAEHRFVSAEDIRTKLHGSWVYYDGTPVWVKTGVSPSDYLKISLFEIRNGEYSEPLVVKVTDPLLQMKDFPMGWFNSDRCQEAVYASRIPMRRYKQGLTEETLSMLVARQNLTEIGATGQYINELLRQKFYSVDDALSLLEVRKSVALSSNVALVKRRDDIRVFVADSDVGSFHAETRTTEVTKAGMYSVVYEDLTKAGIQ